MKKQIQGNVTRKFGLFIEFHICVYKNTHIIFKDVATQNLRSKFRKHDHSTESNRKTY